MQMYDYAYYYSLQFGDDEMALLQVRNFPDEIYSVISEMARAERRSVSQQAILLIERGLSSKESAKQRRRKALERTLILPELESMKGVDFAESVREDRDSR